MDRRSFIRVAAPFVGSAVGAHLISSCRRALDQEPRSVLMDASTKTPTFIPTKAATATSLPEPTATVAPERAAVAIIKAEDRREGVQRALSILEADTFQGKHILIKPNLNTADPAPGSTHNDVLYTTAQWLSNHAVGRISVGDRSGMAVTRRAMQKKDWPAMADEFGFDLIAFDELPVDGWEILDFDGSHWPSGFAVARPVLEADGIVSLCCLKTHQYGGHFTLSLKNSVGMVATRIPGESVEYMTQLHSSASQREMIAEINTAYQPDLVILDAVDAFVNGGPDQGTLVHPGLILAGVDRVAIDAVGVAILRYYGTTPNVQHGAIFEQDQIARAVSLGLGVNQPEKIDLITDGPESQQVAEELQRILLAS